MELSDQLSIISSATEMGGGSTAVQGDLLFFKPNEGIHMHCDDKKLDWGEETEQVCMSSVRQEMSTFPFRELSENTMRGIYCQRRKY